MMLQVHTDNHSVHPVTPNQTQLLDMTQELTLYDRFYEGSTPNSDPAGLFDYSKGQWSAQTKTLFLQYG